MPVYNCERYIKDSIASVVGQLFSNWELIIVNDGSTDASRKLCEEASACDPRIRVISIDNSGVSTARNTAIDHAQGTYLAFLDSDDLLMPETLQTAMEQIQGADWLWWGYRTFPTESVHRIDPVNIYGKKELARQYPLLSDALLINPLWNKLYKREIVEAHHIRFPADISMGEDLIFNLAYADHVEKLCVIGDILYQYRTENNNSLTGKVRLQLIQEQKTLKDAVDAAFSYDVNVTRTTALSYVNVVISEAILSARNPALRRQEWLSLVSSWIKDDKFLRILSETDRNAIPKSRFVMWMIQKRKLSLFYFYFKVKYCILKK